MNCANWLTLLNQVGCLCPPNINCDMYPLHPEGDNDSLVNNIEIENEHEDMKDAEYIAIGVGTLIILALLCYIFVILVKIRNSKNSPSILSWISEEILHLVSFIKFNHKMSTTIESENRYEKLFRKKSGSCIFLDYPRSCKRSDTLFQKSLLLFSTWREYFYSQPTHFSSQPKK